MAEHIHDCIVVGAGPAGSAAALQLAREGLDVVLLERGDRPGEKNVMSGVLIPNKLRELIPDFVDRAPLQRRIPPGAYQRHYLTEDAVLSMPILREYGVDEGPRPFYTVFRSQFDAWFAQQAVDAGAELFTATLAEDLLWEDGHVVGVRTRRGGLRARVVIGADGVNSTVAEKSGLGTKPTPTEVSLIVREILDLPAETIEDRFNLRPGEGALNLFAGVVHGANGGKGIYYSELYTNRDSLSLTAEVPLDVSLTCQVPNYEVLEARERHPYIATMIRGATLREYQAHLIPWSGVSDFGQLYDNGVLLAGDAGRFTTSEGVGSWPSMASGAAAARTVKHACERGDFSRSTLAAYPAFLDEEGMVERTRETHRSWEYNVAHRQFRAHEAETLVRIARRYSRVELREFGVPFPEQESYAHSIWGQIYHELVKPQSPWYIRWVLRPAVWLDTLRWQQRRRGRDKI